MAKVYSETENTIRVCVAFIAMQNTAIRLCLKYYPNDDTRRRNKKRVEVF